MQIPVSYAVFSKFLCVNVYISMNAKDKAIGVKVLMFVETFQKYIKNLKLIYC